MESRYVGSVGSVQWTYGGRQLTVDEVMAELCGQVAAPRQVVMHLGYDAIRSDAGQACYELGGGLLVCSRVLR